MILGVMGHHLRPPAHHSEDQRHRDMYQLAGDDARSLMSWTIRFSRLPRADHGPDIVTGANFPPFTTDR